MMAGNTEAWRSTETRNFVELPCFRALRASVFKEAIMPDYAHSHKGYDFGELTSKIIGACIEVHKVLGPGLKEVDYQRALVYEFQA